MLNLSKEEMQKVHELSTKLWESRKQDASIRENWLEALSQELPEREDTESVVDQLLEGGALLDSNLEKLDNRSLSEVLEEILNGKLEELETQDQYQWLSDMMNGCLQSLNQPEAVMDYVFVPAEHATMEDVTQLKAEVVDVVGTSGLAMLDSVDSADLMDEFSFTEEEQQAIRDSAMDEALDGYLELALYILYKRGEIEALRHLPENFSLKALGAMLRGAVRTAKAKIQALLGKIPWENVLSVMNKVGSVLLLVLGVLLTGGAVSVLAAWGWHTLATTLGAALWISVLGVAAYHIFLLARSLQDSTVEEMLQEYWNRAAELAKRGLERVRSFGQWLKEKLVELWEVLRGRLEGLKRAGEEQTAPTQAQTVNANKKAPKTVQA